MTNVPHRDSRVFEGLLLDAFRAEPSLVAESTTVSRSWGYAHATTNATSRQYSHGFTEDRDKNGHYVLVVWRRTSDHHWFIVPGSINKADWVVDNWTLDITGSGQTFDRIVFTQSPFTGYPDPYATLWRP